MRRARIGTSSAPVSRAGCSFRATTITDRRNRSPILDSTPGRDVSPRSVLGSARRGCLCRHSHLADLPHCARHLERRCSPVVSGIDATVCCLVYCTDPDDHRLSVLASEVHRVLRPGSTFSPTSTRTLPVYSSRPCGTASRSPALAFRSPPSTFPPSRNQRIAPIPVSRLIWSSLRTQQYGNGLGIDRQRTTTRVRPMFRARTYGVLLMSSGCEADSCLEGNGFARGDIDALLAVTVERRARVWCGRFSPFGPPEALC